MRCMLLIVIACMTAATSFSSEKTDRAIEAVRNVRLNISGKQKYLNEIVPDKELLTFDQAKDEVIWVRTYGKKKITQVYEILKERAKMDDTVTVVPLRWVSLTNPSKMDYNADKHDVGLRINKVKDGRWVVKFYSIDSAGQELELKFVEPE